MRIYFRREGACKTQGRMGMPRTEGKERLSRTLCEARFLRRQGRNSELNRGKDDVS